MERIKQLKDDGSIAGNGMNDLHFKEFSNFCLTTTKPRATCDDLRNFVDCETKPAAVITDLIEFFTKQEERVLDVFSGKGSTLNICSELDRVAVGIDGSPVNKSYYLSKIAGDSFLQEMDFHVGDSLWTLKHKDLGDLFDFILVDPPVKKECLLKSDMLDTFSLEEYVEYIISLMDESTFHINQNKFIVLMLQDFYYEGNYKFLPSLIIPRIVSLTFVGMKIYYRDISFRPSNNRSYSPIINHYYALIFKNNG